MLISRKTQLAMVQQAAVVFAVASVLLGACGRSSLSIGASGTTGGSGGGSGGGSVTASTSSAGSVSASTTGPGGGPSCTEEICDGIDNNCDGVVDEGCSLSGCSDGTREGFLDLVAYPKIAACSGGFSVPGLVNALAPQCGFASGNSGKNPDGVGCSAADLCAPGFHVCASAAEVQARSAKGCADAAPSPNLFFATRQSSTGCGVCALGTETDPGICNGCTCAGSCAQTVLVANDLFGCGSEGSVADNCGVLDRTSQNECSALGAPWSCGEATGNGCDEALLVTKGSSAGGGVLCCMD